MMANLNKAHLHSLKALTQTKNVKEPYAKNTHRKKHITFANTMYKI